LAHEEDITFLIKVFYLSSTGLESGAFVNSGSFKISESMLLQIPDFNLVSLEGDNKNLPIGWYLNNLGN
jgi:hypothetical protein